MVKSYSGGRAYTVDRSLGTHTPCMHVWIVEESLCRHTKDEHDLLAI